MQGYCDVYKWTIFKWKSPEVKCLHPTSSMREMCTSSVSNVIYHKFSHGAASYTLKGKNINVMLEYCLNWTVLLRGNNQFFSLVPAYRDSLNWGTITFFVCLLVFFLFSELIKIIPNISLSPNLTLSIFRTSTGYRWLAHSQTCSHKSQILFWL